MKAKILAAIGLAILVFAGLSLSEETRQQNAPTTPTPVPPAAQAPKPEKADKYYIIGYLEKRDNVIAIKSGSKGRVYSVTTKDGKVLHENLSIEQLKAQAPELHDLIKTGNAGDASLKPIADIVR